MSEDEEFSYTEYRRTDLKHDAELDSMSAVISAIPNALKGALEDQGLVPAQVIVVVKLKGSGLTAAAFAPDSMEDSLALLRDTLAQGLAATHAREAP